MPNIMKSLKQSMLLGIVLGVLSGQAACTYTAGRTDPGDCNNPVDGQNYVCPGYCTCNASKDLSGACNREDDGNCCTPDDLTSSGGGA